MVIAAAASQRWTATPRLAIAAFALACGALLCSAWSVRPGGKHGIVGRRLVDQFADCSMDAAAVEKRLIHDRAEQLEYGEREVSARAKCVWVGFGFLMVGAVALAITLAAEILGA